MYKNCPMIVAGFGVGFLGFGILCASYIFPNLAEMAVKMETELVEGSKGWRNWQKLPVPMKFKIYFFNMSNPKEVQLGAAPIVKEVGPYVYDLYREKVRIKINKENDTVEYYERKFYYFNEEDSGCRKQDDYVTIISPVLISTALKLERMMANTLSTMSDVLPFLIPGIKDVFMRATVRDILFDGLILSCASEEIEFVCSSLKSMLPATVRGHPNKRDFLFSVFNHLNGTDEGPYEVQLGNAPSTSKGEIISWHGKQNQTIWYGDFCNIVKGSDGSTYPPIGPDVKKIYVFSNDFCRTLYVEKEREELYKGLPTYRFSSTTSVLALNKDNECYCPRVKNDDDESVMECTPKGTFDIFPCITTPSIVSFPHFYLGDEKLQKWVKGLKPIKKLHENYMNIDPLTGTPLSGHKRIQMNAHVKNYAHYNFDLMANVSEGIIPFLWLDEGVDLPDELLKLVADGHQAMKLLVITKWFFILLGLGLLLVSLVMMMQREHMLCFSTKSSAKISQLQYSPRNVLRPFERANVDYTKWDFSKAENRKKDMTAKGLGLKLNTAVRYPHTRHQLYGNQHDNNGNHQIRMRPQYSFTEEANWTYKN